MFKDEYQDYMSEVRPENSLVESMVEAQRNQRSQRTVRPVRAVRVAAAALCGLLVFSGGTIAVDAATGGGVQRLLGLKDSISVGEVQTEFVLVEPEVNYDDFMVDGSVETEIAFDYGNSMESKIDEGGNVTTVITSSDDAPIFHCYISSEDEKTTFQCARSLKGCETEEDYALTVYWQLNELFQSIKGNKKMCDWIVEELAKVKQEIGSGTDLQDGCAAGVQLMIDDIYSYSGENGDTVVKIYVSDAMDEDGDGDRNEWIGIALLKIDFDEWQKVTEETGRTEFEAEAIAGVPGTYRFDMISYGEELAYYCKKVN